MPSPESLLVLCDGESDAKLFQRIRVAHPDLARIPQARITTYDQARFAKQDTPLRKAVQPLHIDDRPDFIFCYNDKPILVVEMTKHAYTGDNGLQRFARGAVAAENRLPFIYFGPLRRVRDDELDALEDDDDTASARSLTSDIFVGMKRLHEIYGTPQLYAEWHTAENGMPMTLSQRASQEEVAGMYGELLNLIAAALFVDGNPALNDVLSRVLQDFEEHAEEQQAYLVPHPVGLRSGAGRDHLDSKREGTEDSGGNLLLAGTRHVHGRNRGNAAT